MKGAGSLSGLGIAVQAYIPELIQCLEREGLRPVPIFINGVEAHTVVRGILGL